MYTLRVGAVSVPQAENVLDALRALDAEELEAVVASLTQDPNMTLMNVGLALADAERLTEEALTNLVANALEASEWDDLDDTIRELSDVAPWGVIREALIALDKAWEPRRDLTYLGLVTRRDAALYWSREACDEGCRADSAEEAAQLTAQIEAYKKVNRVPQET